MATFRARHLGLALGILACGLASRARAQSVRGAGAAAAASQMSDSAGRSAKGGVSGSVAGIGSTATHRLRPGQAFGAALSSDAEASQAGSGARRSGCAAAGVPAGGGGAAALVLALIWAGGTARRRSLRPGAPPQTPSARRPPA